MADPLQELSVRRIDILLCTRNGERFLSEQLTSIELQSHANWRVWASDDGSTDRTLYLLDAFRQRWGAHRLSLLSGPRRGPSANFMSLVRAVDGEADYFAFCDQDDIWDRDRLASGLAALDVLDRTVPALYCSRTRLIDETGSVVGLSPLFRRPPSFSNALVQSLGGGNTMLFNRPALALLAESAAMSPIDNHDWWAYILVIGCGGHVVYDPVPRVSYRQHGNNVMGRNSGFGALITRWRGLVQDRYREWNDINEAALAALRPRLSEKNRPIFADYRRARHANLSGRIAAAMKAGLHRQTLLGNLGLGVAILSGKF